MISFLNVSVSSNSSLVLLHCCFAIHDFLPLCMSTYIQQENEMFRKMAKKLKWEISELTDGLSSISEQCQEITEENDSLKVNHLNHTTFSCHFLLFTWLLIVEINFFPLRLFLLLLRYLLLFCVGKKAKTRKLNRTRWKRSMAQMQFLI